MISEEDYVEIEDSEHIHCSACTFLNERKYSYCEVCGSPLY